MAFYGFVYILGGHEFKHCKSVLIIIDEPRSLEVGLEPRWSTWGFSIEI